MRPQFHCSNTTKLCDHCGTVLAAHSAGNYYCPPGKVRALSAFHCDYGCKVPQHQPGCPFYKPSSRATGNQS